MKIFVSYTSNDRRWAHWIGWQLREAGHEPFIHEWEIGAGESIPRWMEDRLSQANRLIGVFSDAYCKAIYSQSERWAASWEDPDGKNGFLVPIQVSAVSKWPPFVKPLNRLSLIGLEETQAAKDLIGFLEPRTPPSEKPPFPGSSFNAHSKTALFTEGSEPLGSKPPSFPAQPPIEGKSTDTDVLNTSLVIDPNLSIRCIDDHEPKPQIFGRDDEVETIVNALLEDKTILVAGGPGMGKTAVAIVAFYHPRIAAHFGRRRVFASLETAIEPRAILTKLVETLGLTPTGDEVSLLRIIEASAAERPFAAILDNAETIFDADRGASERLLNLVGQIRGLSLVVTIRGVAPLIPIATQIDNLLKLGSHAARDAFLAVAGNAFRNDDDLTHILQALDGHALSIRLVAAQAIGSSSLAGLRESWDEVHAEILRISGEEESRLTSVRASLALSLNSKRMKAMPLARRLLALLAFLPGGLAEGDAHSLLGDRGTITKARANEAVVCLHQLRLIERRPDRRLRMLTPLRECAKTSIPVTPNDQTRLIDHYLALATKGGKAGSKDWGKVHDLVEAEADNLDPICELAIAASISNKRLYDALFGLAEFNRYSGRGTVQSLSIAAKRFRTKSTLRTAALCTRKLGDIAEYQSDSDAADTRFKEALALYRSIGDVNGEAQCLLGLGGLAISSFNLELGRTLLKKSSTLFRRDRVVTGLAHCIFRLGDIASRRCELETSHLNFMEALALYKSLGDVGSEANCIAEMGGIAFARSDHKTARSSFEDALTLYQSTGDVAGKANCIAGLGQIESARCNYKAALAHFDEALAYYRHLGAVLGESNIIQCIGDIARRRSDGTAHLHYEEALKLYRRIDGLSGAANCLEGLGDIARAHFDNSTARSHYEEAIRLNRRASNVFGVAESMIKLGRLEQMDSEEAPKTNNVEAGFALYFKTADTHDLALVGWQALHRAIVGDNTNDAQKYRDLAMSSWTAIGRLDLVFDWIES